MVHETSSFVSVVPREIEDVPYATFLVFQSCGQVWAGEGEGGGLAKYFMYDGQCENGESVLTLVCYTAVFSVVTQRSYSPGRGIA